MSQITDRAANFNRKAWDSYRRQRDEGLVDIRPPFNKDMAKEFWADSSNTVNYLSAEQVEEFAGGVRGKRLLDMGCGDGEEMFQWARLGAGVVGVDNSPQQIEAAQRNADILGIDCRLVVANLLSLPGDLLDSSFDIVFSSAVTYWIGNLEQWFGNVKAALKSEGIFLLNAAHPITIFGRDVKKDPSRRNSYFLEGPFTEKDAKSSWNPAGDEIMTICWSHTLGSLVTAVGQSGLYISHLVEHPASGGEAGWPGGFTLRAVKD